MAVGVAVTVVDVVGGTGGKDSCCGGSCCDDVLERGIEGGGGGCDGICNDDAVAVADVDIGSACEGGEGGNGGSCASSSPVCCGAALLSCNLLRYASSPVVSLDMSAGGGGSRSAFEAFSVVSPIGGGAKE